MPRTIDPVVSLMPAQLTRLPLLEFRLMPELQREVISPLEFAFRERNQSIAGFSVVLGVGSV